MRSLRIVLIGILVVLPQIALSQDNSQITTETEASGDNIIDPYDWSRRKGKERVGIDAWSRHQAKRAKPFDSTTRETPCHCPEPEKPPDDAEESIDQSLPHDIYYQKLLHYLFDESKYQEQPGTEYLVRTVVLKVKPQQLRRIHTAKLKSDIDGTISDVIYQSRGGFGAIVKEELLTKAGVVVRFLEELLASSTAKFVCFALVYLSVAYLIAELTHRNFFVVLFLTFVVHSFAATYLDCNRRKEAETMVRILRQQGQNPCQINETPPSWYSVLLTRGRDSECFEHLRTNFKGQSLPFCDPLEVTIEFISMINFKFLEESFVKFIGIHKRLTDNLSWPERIFIGILLLCIFGVILKTFLISFIENAFKALFRRGSAAPPARAVASIEPSAAVADRLSEENLKVVISTIQKLADAHDKIATTFAAIQPPISPAPSTSILESRVEEIVNETSPDTSADADAFEEIEMPLVAEVIEEKEDKT